MILRHLCTRGTWGTLAVAGLLMALAGPAAAAAGELVHFIPGTYDLSDVGSGGPYTDTLVVSVSGGIASFTLSNPDVASDNQTWQLPNLALTMGADPIFNAPPGASWDTGAWPYIYFWDAAADGGLTIGNGGGYLVNLFGSVDGPGVVFYLTAVPEPASWALMLAGFAGLGAAVRARRLSIRG